MTLLLLLGVSLLLLTALLLLVVGVPRSLDDDELTPHPLLLIGVSLLLSTGDPLLLRGVSLLIDTPSLDDELWLMVLLLIEGVPRSLDDDEV